jgi:hypothetical protein
MYAKELNVFICQIFSLQPYISRKSKGNLHKQDLQFFQEHLVQVAKLSDAELALFG